MSTPPLTADSSLSVGTGYSPASSPSTGAVGSTDAVGEMAINAPLSPNMEGLAMPVATPSEFNAAIASATTPIGSFLQTSQNLSRSRQDIVNYAKQFLGVKYTWGGTSPITGFDCSGLTQYVAKRFGIALPRTSQQQAHAGQQVDVARLSAGDLVVFPDSSSGGQQGPGHVALYIGNGQILEAPHAGATVRIRKLSPKENVVGVHLQYAGESDLPPAPKVSPSASPAAGKFASLFAAAGKKYGVDPKLLSAIARAESGYNANAKSPAGAIGLMQFMPGTAKGLGIDPRNPTQAVNGAAKLLAQLIDGFGSVDLAVAAYNAGPAAVQKYGGIPPYKETQTYVQRVLGYWKGS